MTNDLQAMINQNTRLLFARNRTLTKILERIVQIEEDDVYQAPTGAGPQAMVQVQLDTERATLRRVRAWVEGKP